MCIEYMELEINAYFYELNVYDLCHVQVYYANGAQVC